MGEQVRTNEQVASQLSIQRGIERIREALEQAFEDEVRDAVLSRSDYSKARLHDYLTGVEEGREPRVHLLFDLFERGALDLTGTLADVAENCFFLGDRVRYQRTLNDWLTIFGTARPVAVDDSHAGLHGDLELWGAGDLVWNRSRARAEDAAGFLTFLLDEPVALWRTRIAAADLRVCAIDAWSGRDDARLVVPPHLMVSEQIRPGLVPPSDRPLLPR